jgi:hypothetical protein
LKNKQARISFTARHTAPLQFALDGIENYLKREHGERRPTDDRGSRQDQKSVI